jgi:aspartyl-tRNA(Asn)/glutamyl-tRNA(Gln) amidotransferase subunit B
MDDEGKTRLLREKESSSDYRYFPEPDIPPLLTEKDVIDRIKQLLPPTPRTQRRAYVDAGLTESEAQMLMDEPKLRELFDAVTKKTKDEKRASSLILTQLMGFLNAHGKQIADAPSAAHIVELVDAVDNGTISGSAAKSVLEEMVSTGKAAPAIIAEKGMAQISDDAAIERYVKEAMEKNPKAIEDFKAGKQQALGAIVGYVMKQTKGQANPGKTQEILKRFL